MDFTGHKSWPDPWELLEDSGYDEFAKALGMLYTLFLSGHDDHSSYVIIILLNWVIVTFKPHLLDSIQKNLYITHYVLLIGLNRDQGKYYYIVSVRRWKIYT